jgi:hypothetical protein
VRLCVVFPLLLLALFKDLVLDHLRADPTHYVPRAFQVLERPILTAFVPFTWRRRASNSRADGGLHFNAHIWHVSIRTAPSGRFEAYPLTGVGFFATCRTNESV